MSSHAASRKSTPPDTLLAQAVSSKLEDGNIRAAIRLLCSEDSPAPPSLENLHKLQEKHPQAKIDEGCLPDSAQFSPLSVEEMDVRKAILSFSAGSSCGPDGIRLQHLKDLVQCREGGSDFPQH